MHPTWRTLNYTGTATTSGWAVCVCVHVCVCLCACERNVEAVTRHQGEAQRRRGESGKYTVCKEGRIGVPLGQLPDKASGKNCGELFLFSCLPSLDFWIPRSKMVSYPMPSLPLCCLLTRDLGTGDYNGVLGICLPPSPTVSTFNRQCVFDHNFWEEDSFLIGKLAYIWVDSISKIPTL